MQKTQVQSMGQEDPLEGPLLFPRESHVQGSLTGCSPWGCTELDMAEVTKQLQHT